ncbi:MAG TPA: hypothetical protein VLX31_13820 [Streptosporangiaceae bacterium]|nr:hypothetical protein [Streptosporangiaceae bacterium]
MGSSLRMEPDGDPPDGQSGLRVRRRPRIGKLAQVTMLGQVRKLSARGEHRPLQPLCPDEKW